MEISCETNDSNATVTFEVRRRLQMKHLGNFTGRLRQEGQTFFIDNFQGGDDGEVWCFARNVNGTNRYMRKGELLYEAGLCFSYLGHMQLN